MHDAQPVLTRLPALPITQGSAHAHHASRAATCKPRALPSAGSTASRAARRSSADHFALGRSAARAVACLGGLLCRGARVSCVLLRLVSGWAERSAPACEEPCCGWVRTHSRCNPVLEEGGRAELRQKVKVAFCRSFTNAYYPAAARTDPATSDACIIDRDSADTPTPIAARVPGEGISSPNTPKETPIFFSGPAAPNPATRRGAGPAQPPRKGQAAVVRLSWASAPDPAKMLQ